MNGEATVNPPYNAIFVATIKADTGPRLTMSIGDSAGGGFSSVSMENPNTWFVPKVRGMTLSRRFRLVPTSAPQASFVAVKRKTWNWFVPNINRRLCSLLDFEIGARSRGQRRMRKM